MKREFIVIMSCLALLLTACSSKDSTNGFAKKATHVDVTQISPEYYVDQTTFQVLPIEDANPQVALLTFDDAPDEYAVEIAHILKDQNVLAIFFVNGMYLEDETGQEKLKKIHELGFEIGNHTQTHASLDTLDYEQTEFEITQTNRLVEEAIGETPRFFRAPFGVNTEYSADVVDKENMEFMNWTYGYDFEPEYQDSEALKDIMVNTELLNYGANLLMHDREWTRDAISDIIKGLQDKDYEFVDPKNISTED